MEKHRALQKWRNTVSQGTMRKAIYNKYNDSTVTYLLVMGAIFPIPHVDSVSQQEKNKGRAFAGDKQNCPIG